jgi:hypothetical protein
MRTGEQLPRFVPRGVHHLRPLALALLPVALDLGLALLEIVLTVPYLFLCFPELCGRGVLGVTLDRVGELGRGANEMERVHPDGMTGRLDRGASAGGLEHAELRLQLRGVTAERVEGLAHALGIEAVAALRDVLEPRQRGQRRGACATRAFNCHVRCLP